MDQIMLRKNRGMRHFNEVEWTILGWQDRRMLDDTETDCKDSDKKDISKSDAFIGVIYVGMLVLFMIAYLT